MNTVEIIRECRRLPGVSVSTSGECTELILSTESGNGRMQFVPLFDGVTLAVIEVHSVSWPAPKLPHSTPDVNGPLIINYCIRGRCELVLNDNKSVFLSAGQISLTDRVNMSIRADCMRGSSCLSIRKRPGTASRHCGILSGSRLRICAGAIAQTAIPSSRNFRWRLNC